MLALKFTRPVSDSCDLPKEGLCGKTLHRSGSELEGYYMQSYYVADNAHNTIKFVDLMKICRLNENFPSWKWTHFPKNEGEHLCRITPNEQEVLNLETEECNGI